MTRSEVGVGVNIFFLLMMFGVIGVLAWARATHRLTDVSHACWDPEKAAPGHYIDANGEHGPVLDAVFKPLSNAEEIVRES